MEKPKINVLIAENNPEGTLFWERIMGDIRDLDISFVHIEKLSDVLKYLETEFPDVILLDLSQPKGGGFEVFLLVYNITAIIPIIVVTGTVNQKLALQTALEGAQDSLIKTDLNGYLLSRSMRYAIGRQKHLKEERAFSVIDELTGLYNRRGFLVNADEKIKASEKTGKSLLLVFADMDGLKTINDTLGHHMGDLALMETSQVLREAFRETDILGRLGGDEFVALLSTGTNINEDSLRTRFRETMDYHNSFSERRFKLSASIGIALYDPHRPLSTANLLANADEAMYQQKKMKKESGNLRVITTLPDPARSVLTESLAETRNEAIVHLMIPIMRKCGVDEGLALQISSWIAKGSRELKVKLIEMIEEIGGVSGGLALRMALFDDSEEIAALAARAIGKTHFTAGLKLILKVAENWKSRSPDSEVILTAVCQALGKLARSESIPFLQDIAGNRPHPGRGEYSLSLRWEALQSLALINPMESILFLEGLKDSEADPQWRKDLEKIVHAMRAPASPLVPVSKTGIVENGPGSQDLELTRDSKPMAGSIPLNQGKAVQGHG